MIARSTDPMVDIAISVAAMIADTGLAFVEDDQVEALADTLSAFFKTAGLPTDEARALEYFRHLSHQEVSFGDVDAGV